MDKRIIFLLKRKRQGLSLQNFFKELRIPRKERARFESRLKNLESQGIIRRIKSHYYLPLQSDVIKGKFLASGRGYGFVVPESELAEDVFIPARFSRGAIQGDVVEVLYKDKGKKGKPEGRVVRVVKKEKKRLIGVYAEKSSQPFFLPFDSASLEEIPLSAKTPFCPIPGMIVAVDRMSLRIAEVLGLPDEPGVDSRVVILRYGLADSFSEAARSEAEKVNGQISDRERARREDYREWRTVTIDGEKAQDFDDAASIKRLGNGNFLLGVHIADVSYYVKPDTSLDRDAYERGTSVYFPDLTLPMLPEKLSNDVCSLRPRQERLTFSVLLEIDRAGNVLHSGFYPSLIRTEERMTYTSVQKIFAGDEEERRRFAHLVPDLLLMKDLARLLREKRINQGSLDFDLIEPELVYKEGRLHSIVSFVRHEAHQVIEEFMVAANEAVASFLSQKHIPSLYRVHPPPAISDLERLQETLAHFGIFLPKASRLESRDLQHALKMAEGKPLEKFVNVQVLRAQRLALYSAENEGHYGLAKKEYTHFTSPIRRYPDLIVHRILKQALKGREAKVPVLVSLAIHLSEQERKADEAEKGLVEWRIFRFLKNKLGEDFPGVIVEINKAGLVVELDDYFVSGLISFMDLGGDYYFQRSRGMVVGKKSGKKYELGERLRVTLASVDPVLRRMNFVLSRESENERR